MTENPLETYKSRLRQCKRGEHLTVWVGAGLAGLVALASGDAFNEAHPLLKAIEITLIILAGACLASARVKFEWEAVQIERKVEDKKIELTNVIPLCECMNNYLKTAKRYWSVTLCLITLAGIGMIVCFWYPFFFPKKENISNPTIQTDKAF